ncbi:aspartate/glutamate racemase family protein [Ruminiclostridium cellobioparum]|uniref:aspartate/glutamate racemase family protein n=2 Tax=Ruminiclostridium cellobioparum TaxID=29355 RepID=UPI0006879FEF|nr:amino acid racemase [Ruminiclostridium cellobioparum]
MNNEKIIGVVGGLGPYAGIDLCGKIMDQTEAKKDQEHLAVALLSIPGRIEDRTSFLLGKSNINPAFAILETIEMLEGLGASVIGIPCNASHCPEIFNIVEGSLRNNGRLKLINMIDEVGEYIKIHYPGLKNIGVMTVTGTYKSNIYNNTFEKKDLKVIKPSENVQNEIVHNAIYNPEFGIKARFNPVTENSRRLLSEGINHLKEMGAEAVVLGCTEMPLAIREKLRYGIPIIDSCLVLARALVREAAPHKLKPAGVEYLTVR